MFIPQVRPNRTSEGIVNFNFDDYWRPRQASRHVCQETEVDGNGYLHKTSYAPNGVENYEVSYNPATGHLLEKFRPIKGDGRYKYASSAVGADPRQDWIILRDEYLK
jgi:hypothetical protein